ncbi:MAG: TIGR00341 family protein [Chloroflexota bacterium]
MSDKPAKAVPDYAHTVIVPIANPKTAPQLLRLAEAFVRRDGGRVIALAVTLSDSDAEVNRDRLDQLEKIVGQFQPPDGPEVEQVNETEDVDETQDAEPNDKDPDAPAPEEPAKPKEGPTVTVEFVTRTANNIARGILDEARQSGAELIIIGVQSFQHGDAILGVVAQSVISAAAMDVLVYRTSSSPEFDRILVPVDGSAASRMAVRMGILFGNAFKNCPVEAIHVKTPDRTEADGRERIARAVDDLPGNGVVKRTLINAQSIANAILSRVDKDQLIIMGFSRRSDFQDWLKGESKTLRIMKNAPGPLLLAVRSTEAVTEGQKMRRRFLGWLRPMLTDVEQEQIVWTADRNASLTLDYVVLMIVAATLASLGLLLNSAAVIIGAMLVAPLMSPLNAFAIGLSTAHFRIMRRALVTALVGFLIATVVSYFVGIVVPSRVPTPEMMSRVSPTLLDAFVALASGVVGAYATARRDIPAALAGVAIAAALVPPICTFGLQIAFGNIVFGLGAALLFLMNIVSIVVIATVIFLWLGLYPRNLDRRSLPAYVPTVILVLMSLPMVIVLLGTLQRAQNQGQIETVVEHVFEGMPIDAITVSRLAPTTVTVRVVTPFDVAPEAVAAAEAAIEREIGADEDDLTLRVIAQQLVTADEPDPQPMRESSFFAVEDGVIVPAQPNESEPPAPDDASASEPDEGDPTPTP